MVNSITENRIGSHKPTHNSRKGAESNASRPVVGGLLRVNGGAFQVARKLFQSEVWLSKPSTWKVIWIYILGNVNHKAKNEFSRGEGFFMFSKCLPDIGNDITKDMVKKSIIFFKQNEMISTKRSTRGVKIKVLKYDIYQSLDSYGSTGISTKKALRKHQESTPINKNDKNDKNIASETDAKLPLKKKSMRTYNEREHSDEDEPSIDLDTREVIKKPTGSNAKYPHSKEVFALFPDPQKSWGINTTELKHSELLYERGIPKVKSALAYYAKHKDEDFSLRISKPSDLERKWVDLIDYADKHD